MKKKKSFDLTAELLAALISAKNELIDLGIDDEYLEDMNVLLAKAGVRP